MTALVRVPTTVEFMVTRLATDLFLSHVLNLALHHLNSFQHEPVLLTMMTNPIFDVIVYNGTRVRWAASSHCCRIVLTMASLAI